MEVKNEKLFLIYTIILVTAMVFIVVLFSQHPMGADFTKYNELTPEMMGNLDTLNGQRIVVRGVVNIARKNELFTIQKQGMIIGWIRKRFEPTRGRMGQTSYEDFKTSDFTVTVGGKKLMVKGQPEQVFDSKNRINSDQDPNIHWEVIREGKEYSIFGTLHANGPDDVYLIPYRVTNLPVSDIKTQAAKANKQITFIQYFSIFAFIIVYCIGLWKGNVFGPATEEDEEEPAENQPEKVEVSDDEENYQAKIEDVEQDDEGENK